MSVRYYSTDGIDVIFYSHISSTCHNTYLIFKLCLFQCFGRSGETDPSLPHPASALAEHTPTTHPSIYPSNDHVFVFLFDERPEFAMFLLLLFSLHSSWAGRVWPQEWGQEPGWSRRPVEEARIHGRNGVQVLKVLSTTVRNRGNRAASSAIVRSIWVERDFSLLWPRDTMGNTCVIFESRCSRLVAGDHERGFHQSKMYLLSVW